MNKIRLIAGATYRQQVRAGTFLILTFALPVLMLLAGTVAFVAAARSAALPTVGVVDETQQLTAIAAMATGETEWMASDDTRLDLMVYDDRAAARAALQNGAIGAYLVIPPDYSDGAPPLLTAPDGSSRGLEDGLAAMLRHALLAEQAPWLATRLDEPTAMSFSAQARNRTVAGGFEMVARVLIPIMLAIAFGLLVFTSASQMGAAMIREKDARAMEIIVTSAAPRQLLVGKVLGLTLGSLTQMGVWLVGAALALGLALTGLLGAQSLNLGLFDLPWRPMAWTLLLGLPGYFLYAVLAAGLGVIAGDGQQARQLASLFGMLALVPLWFMGVIVTAPDSALAVTLTLFPLTSPIVSPFRMVFTQVPTWQLLLALGAILVSLAVSVWAVARIFRAAMLLYGQALRPRAIWQALAVN